MYRGQIGRPLTFRAPTPVLLFQGFRAQSPQDRLAPARSNVAIDTHTGRCVDTGKRERATQTVDRSIDRQETQTFWSYCIRHLLWTSIYTHETHTQTVPIQSSGVWIFRTRVCFLVQAGRLGDEPAVRQQCRGFLHPHARELSLESHYSQVRGRRSRTGGSDLSRAVLVADARGVRDRARARRASIRARS